MKNDAAQTSAIRDVVTTIPNCAGMTLVEVLMVSAIVPITLAVAASFLQLGSDVHQDVNSRRNAVEKLRTTLRRVSDELRVSSRTAEDLNGNGHLDLGEDRNGNGRLESDWNLGSSTVTFNRMNRDGFYSLPIRYELVGANLIREARLSADSDATLRTVITSGVSSFAIFSDPGGHLKLSLTVAERLQGGEFRLDTASLSVKQRN